MSVTTEMIKDLRDRTGAGMMDCKKALTEVNGNLDQAIEFLRKKGLAIASKKAARSTGDGAVQAYIHGGGKIGVLVEVNCETDFVARTDDFQELVRDIAMHVAAANPMFVKRDDVPEDVKTKERAVFVDQAKDLGKPAAVLDKIVDGKMDKYFADICLVEQAFVKDPDKTIGDLLTEKIAKLGENISIKRFVRFQLGDQA
ncbi:MAG: translation elongation factor Ts [Bdellovibrionota bacterium]